MNRSVDARVADVRRLVDAARAIARDLALRDALVRTTHLSPQGVDLALTEHLETSPTEEDLVRLVERAGDASSVHVVLSANVFVGALRALAVARAAAPRVVVIPSRREPAFACALAQQASDPGLAVEDALAVESVLDGEIHVYGQDATIADIRARARSSVRVRGHGTGLGVAYISSRADLDEAAAAIAADVAPFDQRGCLSPRIVLVEGDMRRGEALSSRLDQALALAEERVPRGELARDEVEEIGRYESSMAFAGHVWRAANHLIALAPAGAPLLLAPPGRHLHVAAVNGIDDARALLTPVARFVTAIGRDDAALGDLVDHAVRVSALGKMQKPALDGPVDLRD